MMNIKSNISAIANSQTAFLGNPMSGSVLSSERVGILSGDSVVVSESVGGVGDIDALDEEALVLDYALNKLFEMAFSLPPPPMPDLIE